MAKSSMRSIYKILQTLDSAENGMNYRQLKLRFPFVDIDSAVASLETLGYISHRITGYKVRVKRETKISHDYNSQWYPTDLGMTALEQYQAEHPPSSKKLILILIAVCAACAIIFYLVSRPAVP